MYYCIITVCQYHGMDIHGWIWIRQFLSSSLMSALYLSPKTIITKMTLLLLFLDRTYYWCPRHFRDCHILAISWPPLWDWYGTQNFIYLMDSALPGFVLQWLWDVFLLQSLKTSVRRLYSYLWLRYSPYVLKSKYVNLMCQIYRELSLSVILLI